MGDVGGAMSVTADGWMVKQRRRRDTENQAAFICLFVCESRVDTEPIV